MKIGIIGTGRIGLTLGRLWAKAGHDILLGSRTQSRADEAAAELDPALGIQGTTIEQLPSQTDLLLFAFPWYALTDVERALGKLEGHVIIDCINPITSSGSLAVGHKTSAGEIIQKTFYKAKVVKALNHIHFSHFDRPQFSDHPADAFYCTDYEDAGIMFEGLAQGMGFNPVYLGPIKHARYLEPLAMVWIQTAFFLGRGTEFTLKLLER